MYNYKPAAYRPTLEISITDFSTCVGLGEQGNPLKHTDVFTTLTKKISICGHLQTNHEPIYISALWLHKGDTVFRDHLELFEGYFHSTYQPENEKYALGEYTVLIIVGKNAVQTLTFTVKRSN